MTKNNNCLTMIKMEKNTRKAIKMENIKLAIITKDQEYGRALGFALVEVYNDFTVTLYQSGLLHNQMQDFDLILTDFGMGQKGKVISLVEKPSMVENNYEEQVFRLYKYGNVRQLAGKLLYIYSHLTGRKALPIKKKDMKLIAFCSLEGGTGCTSVSMALARELSRFHDKKVMYLSLEELESTLDYMEGFPDGKSVSEYLYHLFNEAHPDRIPFIESFLVFDDYGVEAFLPSPGRNVLKSLSPEEMQHFIGAVMDTARYDVLVLDLGFCLDKNALCCYEMANHVCMVANQETSMSREERFIEYLTFLKGEKLVERIVKVWNRLKETGSEPGSKEKKTFDENEGLMRVICKLPEDPNSFFMQEGLKTIRSDGMYGKEVKALADFVLGI